MKKPNYRKILINLCTELPLCDHMGDVFSDVIEALKQAKVITKKQADSIDEFRDVMAVLHKKGATTLHGTSVDPAEEEA